MKSAFTSTGLTSVALIVLTFLSLSAAWPRRHIHHTHNTRNISTGGLATSSVDSGSALILRPVNGNDTSSQLYVYSLEHREVISTKVLSSGSLDLTSVVDVSPHSALHLLCSEITCALR